MTYTQDGPVNYMETTDIKEVRKSQTGKPTYVRTVTHILYEIKG